MIGGTASMLAWYVLEAAPPPSTASVLLYNFSENSSVAAPLRTYLERVSPCYLYKEEAPAAKVEVLEAIYANDANASRLPGKRSLIFAPSSGCTKDPTAVQVEPKWVIDLNGPHAWSVAAGTLRRISLPEYSTRIPRDYRADFVVDLLQGRFDAGSEIPGCRSGECRGYQRWWVNNHVGRPLESGRALLPRLSQLLGGGEGGSYQLAVATILSAYNSPGVDVAIQELGGKGSRLSELCKTAALRYAGPGSIPGNEDWSLSCEQEARPAIIRLNEADLREYEERLPPACAGAELFVPNSVGVAIKKPGVASELFAFLYLKQEEGRGVPYLDLKSTPSRCSGQGSNQQPRRRWTVRSTPVATVDWLDTTPSDKPLPTVLCAREDKVRNLFQIAVDVEYESVRGQSAMQARAATVEVTGQYRDMPAFSLVAQAGQQGCVIPNPSVAKADCNRLESDEDPLEQIKRMLRIRTPFVVCRE